MTESSSPHHAPSPAAMAAAAAARAEGPGEPADHPSITAAEDLVVEAAMVRESADEEFDLGALARQAEVLTQAHDRLSAALEDAGRG